MNEGVVSDLNKDPLQPYISKNLINFPISLFLIQKIFTSFDSKEVFGAGFDELIGPEENGLPLKSGVVLLNNFEIGKDEKPQAINQKWFFFNKNKNLVKTVGKLLRNPKQLNSEKDIVADESSYRRIEEATNNYLKQDNNYHKMTFGIEELCQKIVVEVFCLEKTFFKSLLIKFTTGFFESEHLISLDSYEVFSKEIKSHIKEQIHHLHDVLIHASQNLVQEEEEVNANELNYLFALYLSQVNNKGIVQRNKEIEDHSEDESKNSTDAFCFDKKNFLWRVDVNALTDGFKSV